MGFDSWFLLALLLLVMVVLAAEWLAVDVVSISLVVALVLSGILTPEQAFAGFASEIILILCCIFVLSGALVRTGIMEWLGSELHRRSGGEASSVALIMSLSAAASAFLSNTNVTAVMMPAVLESARHSRLNPSRLLIPLAYASMLGGAATLIGTSTNLAASGLVAQVGLEPFSLFEFLPVGAVLSVLGILYMVVLGRRMLPHRGAAPLSAEYELQRYLSDIVLSADSPLAGVRLRETSLAAAGIKVLAIRRGERRVFPDPQEFLSPGDVLIVQASRQALLELHDLPDTAIEAVEERGDDDLVDGDVHLAEAVVMPQSMFEGRTLTQLNFRRRYGLAVLAIQRRGQAHPAAVSDLPLRVGDVLLLHGAMEELESLAATRSVWVMGEVAHLRFRKRKGMIALAAIVGAVAVGGAGLMPLSIAMLLAVLVVVATRVVRVSEIYRTIEWPLIVLIGGMTSMGVALQSTGTADRLAEYIAATVAPFGLTATLAVFAIVTMILTQPMSNAAAALVMLPVAISTATAMGVDPRSMAVLVTLSASLSFVAPLEPACLLVFAPGKYRFADFLKAGLPMSLLTLITLLILVPLIWPL